MAYIGAEPVPGQNREVDDISSGFNGNATAFTLQVNSVNVSPESANNILINLGGVLQNPGYRLYNCCKHFNLYNSSSIWA